MNELQELLGMDLPDEAKALLSKVDTSVKQLTEANENFMSSIESKDNAIAEITAERKELRSKVAELKESQGGRNKDNSEQIEAINAEWKEKYGALETAHNGLKTQVAESERLKVFNDTVIPKLSFPDWYTDEHKAKAIKAIQNDVFEGSVYDNGEWGYGEAGKLHFDTNTGKPLSIEGKALSLLDGGAFDIYIGGKQGSGGGSQPNSGGGNNSAKVMSRSNFESLSPNAQKAFMADGGQLNE